MQPVSSGDEYSSLLIPPPLLVAELPEKVQLSSSGDEASKLCIAPPLLWAELPEKVQLVRTGDEPALLYIPPPSSATLPVKAQSVSTGDSRPKLEMPPPCSATLPLMVQLVRLAEEPRAHDAQPVNIGWADPISIADLAHLILKLSGMERKKLWFNRSQPDGHEVREFCCKRLVDLIGPPPSRPIEDTLADMIEEFAAGRAHL